MGVFTRIDTERNFWDCITNVFFFSLTEMRSPGIFRLPLLSITIHCYLSWGRPQPSLQRYWIGKAYMLKLWWFVFLDELIINILDSESQNVVLYVFVLPKKGPQDIILLIVRVRDLFWAYFCHYCL